MRSRPHFLGWGVFLVCLGAVPLAVQLGVLDARTAASVLRLWPLILVGIGLSIVLQMTRYRELGGVVSGATFGLVAGVFLAGGLASAAFVCGDSEPSAEPQLQSGVFDGATAQLNVELTCGKIDLTRTADAGWSVSVATDGDSPVVRNDFDTLDLRSASSRGFGPWTGGSNERWSVALPAATDLNAGITLNAASGSIALGQGALTSVSATLNGADAALDLRGASGTRALSTTLNASSARLYLPDVPIDASITLNVSSLKLCAPPSLALRVGYTNVLGSHNFDAVGLQGSGESWSTPGAGASVTTLHVTSNLSSISLDRSGECA